VGAEIRGRAGTGSRRGFFSGPPVRLSWGAIFGGAIVALGVYALLYAFGLAVGLTAINPDNANSLRASGIFTGIWALIVPIVSLFIGGAVASRGADVVHRAGGVIHGLIVWGLVTVAGAWLLTNVLSSVATGVGGVAAMAGSAMGPQGYGTQAYEAVVSEALAPVNDRLAAEGKPIVRVERVQSVVTSVVGDAIRQGQMNRESLITAMTQNAGLGRADAEVMANRVQARFGELGQTAQGAALRAADATGKAFWGVFAVLLLSLVSAILGSTIGVAKRQRTAPAPFTTLPPTFPHEVHP